MFLQGQNRHAEGTQMEAPVEVRFLLGCAGVIPYEMREQVKVPRLLGWYHHLSCLVGEAATTPVAKSSTDATHWQS